VRLSSGARFDRYVIEALLGEGGMGRVYRAFDPRLQRRVALKVLDGSASGTAGLDGRGVAAILREARAAAALDAPNVVAIYDLGDHQGVPFLAMELVQGQSLRALVGRREVPAERRLSLLVQIARALSAAHRAGVIHRDVKPENIMVRDDDVVKVLDFGIADRSVVAAAPDGFTDAAAIDAQLAHGALVGTPLYMAPEQVRGLPLDGRADQFAWGVVAYELLAGRSPWTRRETLNDALHAVLHEEPTPLSVQVEEGGEIVDAVVMRALSKDRQARFASMSELLDALGAPEVSQGAGPPHPAEELNASPSDVTVTLPGPRSSGSGPGPPPSGPRASSKPPISRGAPTAKETSISRDASISREPPAASQIAEPREAPRSSLRRAIPLGLVAAAIAVASAVTVTARPKATPPAPPIAASATAAPASTALMELPAPRGCSEVALTEYQRGMQTMHDGNWERAAASFERAASADPDCAGALLRVIMTRLGVLPVAETRALYQRATELRGKLEDRDRQLLEALELLVRREPSDERGYYERVRALAERYPGDAELWGTVATHTSDNEAIIAAARRALAIDPGYSDALQALGRALWASGQADAALATLQECVRVAPNSVDCLRERISVLERAGRCAEAAESAKLWIARDPTTSEGYLALGSMLSSQGAVSAEEAFHQRWARLPEPKRRQTQGVEQAELAALSGDLATAERQARALLDDASGTPSFELHARPALLLVDLLTEQGRSREAAAIAAGLLTRRSAWSTSLLQTGNLDVALDLVEPRLLLAARRGDRLSEADWRAARARWVSSVSATGLVQPDVVWAVDAAMPAETAAEAEAALAARPPEPPGSEGKQHGGRAYVGRALLLAGRVGEAVAYLRAASSSCAVLIDPIVHTQTHLWLGMALEKQSDPAGACAAYAVVARRLGGARTRSLSAEAAKKRADALGCKR
jgi:serine/threonine-protein kinase